MHECSEERQKISGGQSSNRPSIFQQQQDQTYGYGTAPQQTKVPVSPLPEELYGSPPTYATPTSIHHPYTHHDGRLSMQHHYMHSTLRPAVPLQWNSSVSTQFRDQYSGTEPATLSQPIQAGRLQPCTSPTYMTTGPHPVLAPTGSHNSGFGWNTQSVDPATFRGRPIGVNAPLVTGSDSSPAGYRSAAGRPRPVSAVALPDSIQEPTRPVPDEDSRARSLSGLSASNIVTHPHLMRPISPDAFVYPGLSQPERSWCDSEGMPIHLYQPGDPSRVPILSPAGHPSLGTLSSPTPAEVVPHGGSSFQATPQANPATCGQSLGLEAGGSGTDSNLGTTNGGPIPASQPPGLNRSDRTSRRRSVKPYERSTKTRPIPHEGNLTLLRQRCREQGADEIAVGFLPKIFENNAVQLEALTRPFTDAEVESGEFGGRTGKVYTAFLNYTQEDHAGAPRHICRLCRSDQTWKHAKDVLRHLRRDHFGLSTICEQWYALYRSSKRIVDILTRKCSDRKFYTPGEMTRHRCK